MTDGRAEAHSLWTAMKAEYERYQASIQYIPTNQLKLQEDLRKYLCIRFAGFLEQVTHTVLTEYLSQKSSGPILAFSKSHFKRAPNLKVQALLDLIGRFDDEKRGQLVVFLDQENRKAVLDDLLEVRNDVAHGKVAGGRKLDPLRYFEVCEALYVWLVGAFLGESVVVVGRNGGISGYENTQS